MIMIKQSMFPALFAALGIFILAGCGGDRTSGDALSDDLPSEASDSTDEIGPEGAEMDIVDGDGDGE